MERGQVTRVEHSSAEHGWQTPDDLVDKVRAALGWIALDPCTVTSNPTGARCFFTEADDGLSHPWVDGFYCNPPYGRELPKWSAHIAKQDREGIVLTAARTDTRWFHELWEWSDMRLLIKGRLRFKGAPAKAPFPSILFYRGPHPRVFANVFKDDGIIC